MGYLDSIIDQAALGWAESPNGLDDPAVLDIFIDNEFAGETVADLFREDLQRQNIREGYAAFSFAIPLNFFDGQEHSIRIAVRANGEVLRNCPLNFRGSTREMPFVRERIDWAQRMVLLRSSHRAALLGTRIRQLKELAVLATFHPAPKFLRYHFTLARMLTDAGFVVLVVHSATVFNSRLSEIDRDDCFLYAKRNLGYDFGSWAMGIYSVSDLLDEIDELVLINDSVIGLHGDISANLERMRSAKADAVGFTDSYERSYHLQSYFLWFGPRFCRSGLLQAFMARYPFTSEKDVAIKQGEIGLSRFLLEQGFSVDTLYPYERIAGAWLKTVPQLMRAIKKLPTFDPSLLEKSHRTDLLQKLDAIAYSVLSGTPVNPTHFFWDVLLAQGHPFLKRELAILNPGEVPTYFRLADALSALPSEIRADFLEIRQLYGGERIPCIVPREETKPLRPTERPHRSVEHDRSGNAKGGALVA